MVTLKTVLLSLYNYTAIQLHGHRYKGDIYHKRIHGPLDVDRRWGRREVRHPPHEGGGVKVREWPLLLQVQVQGLFLLLQGGREVPQGRCREAARGRAGVCHPCLLSGGHLHGVFESPRCWSQHKEDGSNHSLLVLSCDSDRGSVLVSSF